MTAGQRGEFVRRQQIRLDDGLRRQGALRDAELDAVGRGHGSAAGTEDLAALELAREGVETDVLVADIEQHLGGAVGRRNDEVDGAGAFGSVAAELSGFEARAVEQEIGDKGRFDELLDATGENEPLFQVGLDRETRRPRGDTVGGERHNGSDGACRWAESTGGSSAKVAVNSGIASGRLTPRRGLPAPVAGNGGAPSPPSGRTTAIEPGPTSSTRAMGSSSGPSMSSRSARVSH